MTDNIKKPDELLKIMRSSAVVDKCFEHILNFVKVGMTELRVAEEIESTLYKLGATDLSFPVISVSGKNGSEPHGIPSEKKIEDGDFLTMDFGAVYQGYCSDMTRTIAFGNISDFQKKVYNTVLESQKAGLLLCKDGVSCRSVDSACRKVISDAGFGEYFIHGTGHGVGQVVHENPYLNQKSEEILRTDMAVTVEPGIYIPNELGVRIEDLVVITSFGIINTVNSPKELIIM